MDTGEGEGWRLCKVRQVRWVNEGKVLRSSKKSGMQSEKKRDRGEKGGLKTSAGPKSNKVLAAGWMKVWFGRGEPCLFGWVMERKRKEMVEMLGGGDRVRKMVHRIFAKEDDN